MLAAKTTDYAIDLYDREMRPVDTTIFNPLIRFVSPAPPEQGQTETGGFMQDTEPTYFARSGDGSGGSGLQDAEPGYYQRSGDGFKPSTAIPDALGIQTTDKASQGVFEKSPLMVNRGSVFDRLLNYKPDAMPPVNATLLNNPAVEGFETVRTGSSPLLASYSDQMGQVSGQDPATSVGLLTASTPDTTTEESTAIPGVPSALDFFTKASVRKETYVFVIGAIILAIGIFALTRS